VIGAEYRLSANQNTQKKGKKKAMWESCKQLVLRTERENIIMTDFLPI